MAGHSRSRKGHILGAERLGDEHAPAGALVPGNEGSRSGGLGGGCPLSQRRWGVLVWGAPLACGEGCDLWSGGGQVEYWALPVLSKAGMGDSGQGQKATQLEAGREVGRLHGGGGSGLSRYKEQIGVRA